MPHQPNPPRPPHPDCDGRLCVPPLFAQSVLQLSVIADRSRVVWLAGEAQRRTPREAPMTATALRIDPDGKYLDLALSVHDSGALLDELRLQVTGDLDFAHYRRRDESGLHAVEVVVYEWSQFEMVANPPATRAIEALTGQRLGYRLHGPVVFMGWDGAETTLPLSGALRAELLAAMGAVR